MSKKAAKQVNLKSNNNQSKKSNPPKKLTTQNNKKQEETLNNAPKQDIVEQEPKKDNIIMVKPKMSEEELVKHNSAIKIQSKWRQFKSIEKLKKLKQEKKDLDDKLQQLEKEAYVKMIKLEQEREEKKRLKKLKEQELKRKREARKKRFMDAAYDGNLQEMKFLINDLENELNSMQNESKLDTGKRKEVVLSLIDCKDSNNNSALSEASAGGSPETVKFLLSNNADPNSRGAFGRTPLWRSAFAGHLNCVQILLENGADPRLYSQDGQRVIDAATKDNVIDLLKNWNIQLTERMLQQIDKSKREMKQEQINGLEERKRIAKDEYTKINQQYEIVKNELYKCNCELQRLNDEYLLNPDMYGPLIQKKDLEKIDLTQKYEDLREKSVKARINYKDLLTEFKKEIKDIKEIDQDENSNNKNLDNNENDEEDDDDDDDVKIIKINIKEIDDLILRDLTNIVKSSIDKWPLIIDQNDQATTFLRYRDTNYVNCLDIRSMEREKFRLALLGSIRYGKPFVLDLMQYDQELLESIKSVCDQIDANLFYEMCNKDLLKEEKYLRLIKLETDGKEYEPQNFSKTRIDNFKLIFLTSNPYPKDKLLKLTLPIKIITNKKDDFDEF